ncbi:hypothetical protein OB920_05405 [Halobacteria archaeon HArc-gm2]|nr:hypothetical protein [Halobacteria archaeon HArc-gm2]
MDLRVRKPDGWTTVSLDDDDVEAVTVAGGRTDGHLSLTLIGVRSSQPNVRVQDVLDVDPDDESKLASEVPRADDGTCLPLDQLRPD